MAGMKCLEYSDQILAKNVNYVYSNALKSPESSGQVCRDSDWKLTFYTLNEAESAVAVAEHFLWKPEPSQGLHAGARSQWFLGHHFPDWIYYNSEQPLSFCTLVIRTLKANQQGPQMNAARSPQPLWHPKGQLIPFCLSCF